jgi:hypothetical protein
MLGEWYLPPGACQVISTITEGTISISQPPSLSAQTRTSQTSSLPAHTSHAPPNYSDRKSGGLRLRKCPPTLQRPSRIPARAVGILTAGWAGLRSHTSRTTGSIVVPGVIETVDTHASDERATRSMCREKAPVPRTGQRKMRWAKRYRLFFHSVGSCAWPSTCQTCGTPLSFR